MTIVSQHDEKRKTRRNPADASKVHLGRGPDEPTTCRCFRPTPTWRPAAARVRDLLDVQAAHHAALRRAAVLLFDAGSAGPSPDDVGAMNAIMFELLERGLAVR